MRPARLLLAAALALALALPARPQDAATLVADRVTVEPSGALIAEGDVEVTYEGTRLTAAAVRYDREGERLTIQGPIRLDDGDGVVILADAAELDDDLREGILSGARLVLDEQLQIAAVEIARAGGRYTQLYRSVASSCTVCPSRPVPLWEIRASRIVQDEQERQIYFENAQLRVRGLPVAYLPRLRLPAPGNDRATGFLAPELRFSTLLGNGLAVPYFITLGQSRDLTLTPYLAERTRTLGLRYRQAFRAGAIEITGAVSTDDLDREQPRGYVFATGDFDLPMGFDLDFGVQFASDDTYLNEYDITSTDRLVSSAQVERVRPREYVAAGAAIYDVLRPNTRSETKPRREGAATYLRRFGSRSSGLLDLALSADGYARESGVTFDTSLDDDLIPDGRDGARIGAALDYRVERITAQGLSLAGIGRLGAQRFAFAGTEAADDAHLRVDATAGADLRWPLRRASASGAVQVVEPRAQLLWTGVTDGDVPNEDSVAATLDAGNLFAISRFPGEDAVEEGARANLGLAWRRYDPAGWNVGLAVGRVLHAGGSDLPEGSGLDDGETASDWLAEADLDLGTGLTLAGSALVDDDLDVTRAEALARINGEGFGVAAGYVWLAAYTGLDGIRRDDASELNLAANYDLTARWSGSATVRYDLRTERAERSGLGIVWRNECAQVDFSLSRRYLSSVSLETDTTFDVSVELLGFGRGEAAPERARPCKPVIR